MNRRFFLRGLGSAALALPVLPSLLPRAAWAAAPTPRRYVQILNPYGPTGALFYGNLTGATQAAPNVRTRALSSVSGPLSSILGTSFDGVRGKMNLVRGLDTPVNNPNHQFCFATCASGYAPGLDGDGYPPQSGNDSIDVVLAASGKVTPAGTPASRALVNFNPLSTDDYSSDRSFSWRRSSGNPQMVSPLKATNALLNLFMGSFGMATMPQADGRELSLVQAVNGDYKALRSNPRLSSADLRKLDSYIALIDDLERQASTVTPPPSVCAAPTAEAGSSADALVRTQLRVLAAAFACDLTRVGSVTLGMSAGYDTRHAEHHTMYDLNVPSGTLADLRGFAGNVAWFLSHLDSISADGGGAGTLLDNAIVYWSMQYGCATANDTHASRDMPVLIGGKGGGALSTGNFIDYGVGGVGLPLNNLLVTFFNAMGLGSSDYEKVGNTGFGLYTGSMMSGRSDVGTWTSTAGRRTPLPVLYTGPAQG